MLCAGGARDERESGGNRASRMPSPSLTLCSSPTQDTVTGFLLAGVGHVDLRRHSNFLIVNDSASGERELEGSGA